MTFTYSQSVLLSVSMCIAYDSSFAMGLLFNLNQHTIVFHTALLYLVCIKLIDLFFPARVLPLKNTAKEFNYPELMRGKMSISIISG